MPQARVIPLHRLGGGGTAGESPAGPATAVAEDRDHAEPQWYRELLTC